MYVMHQSESSSETDQKLRGTIVSSHANTKSLRVTELKQLTN